MSKISLREEIEEGDIKLGRVVVFRRILSTNPQRVETVDGDTIAISFVPSGLTLERDVLEEIHGVNIRSTERSPGSRGAQTMTGVYSINRGFIGALNLYKISTLISEDFVIPEWYRRQIEHIKRETEDLVINIPRPINMEIA